jgi:tetratricopeptide (TPR) repeat protein
VRFPWKIRRWPLAALAAAGALALTLFLLPPGPEASAGRIAKAHIPADAAAAADFVAARDHWARRTPADLARAIALYQGVISREPDFAPAYAGLAEAWLIYREYGEVGDLEAYNAAHTATIRALSLDPDLAAAHRAMGFIHYWRENDGPRAVAAFKRAIQLNDADAQTHFWYANVLADIGSHDLARRAYDRARLLSPGSQVIEVEAACAEWQAGRDAVARERLTSLARRYPDDATVHNCLAWLHMSRGDIHAFARSYTEMARSRNQPDLIRRAAELNAAVQRDPKTAHRILTTDMRREIASGERRGRETPAFYASAMGDREELLLLMKEARAIGEQWYSSTIVSRIAARWRSDAEVQSLLGTLRAPRPGA